jgi:hypothetical protein
MRIRSLRHQAAAPVPGAAANTLKRRIRQGKLTAYRSGKSYLTTVSDIKSMLKRDLLTGIFYGRAEENERPGSGDSRFKSLSC